MNHFTFKQMNGEDISRFLGNMFSLLFDNMSVIAPTGNTYDEDFECWSQCMIPILQNGKSKVILIFQEDHMCGYFQYSVIDDTFKMEEIQFSPEYQGSGMFEELYRYLIVVIPMQTKYTEAYSHKNNVKSQGILKHLGLAIVGENKSGRSYHFRGEYQTLLERYSK